MTCEILRTIYIKANGEILCNDDFGERVILGDLHHEAISSVITNEQYSHIRISFRRRQIPWEGICNHCAFLRDDQDYDDKLRLGIVEKLQVESSITCTLECPACINSVQVRTRKPPLHLPCDVFRGSLVDLKQNGFQINEVEYCGQGEPLMHPHFNQLVLICREIYPNAKQRLITNGNFDYQKKLGDSLLDEIYISCDGCRQESYEKYRIKGKIDKVFKFMHAAVSAAKKTDTKIIWKYILFEYNDNDDELIEAQRMADQLRVTNLLFVFSHSPQRSKRYPLDKALLIPILYDNVVVNAHPSFYKRSFVYRSIDIFSKDNDYIAYIDEIRLFSDSTVTVKGWILAKKPISGMVIQIEELEAGEAILGLSRPDVLEFFPGFDIPFPGFRWSGTMEGLNLGEELSIILKLNSLNSIITLSGKVYRIPNLA